MPDSVSVSWRASASAVSKVEYTPTSPSGWAVNQKWTVVAEYAETSSVKGASTSLSSSFGESSKSLTLAWAGTVTIVEQASSARATVCGFHVFIDAP